MIWSYGMNVGDSAIHANDEKRHADLHLAARSDVGRELLDFLALRNLLREPIFKFSDRMTGERDLLSFLFLLMTQFRYRQSATMMLFLFLTNQPFYQERKADDILFCHLFVHYSVFFVFFYFLTWCLIIYCALFDSTGNDTNCNNLSS